MGRVILFLAVWSIPVLATSQGKSGDSNGAVGDLQRQIDELRSAVEQRIDPPCYDDNNRYVDCLNGTVTDTVSGLVWLQDVLCLYDLHGVEDWRTSSERAAALGDGECGLTDGSQPGDWRLPTIEEWHVMSRRADDLNCWSNVRLFRLTDNAGTACLGAEYWKSAFIYPPAGWSFWTSTSDELDPSTVFLGDGFLRSKTIQVPALWLVRR